MGGRGASAGLRGGAAAPPQYSAPGIPAGSILSNIITGMLGNKTIKNASTNSPLTQKGTYTDNNNPALVKFQNQDNDKTASFLSSVDKNAQLTPAGRDSSGNMKYNIDGTNDASGFYNNPWQKLSLKLGLNNKPTVVSEARFKQIQKATGAEVFYRGWSSNASAQRFLSSDLTHQGNGVYGDGIYFANNTRTARGYGSGAMTKMMLSPSAQVIDYATLTSSMPSRSDKLGRSLSYAGSLGTRSYGPNDGEAQWALKNGYNVVRVDHGNGNPYYFALTRDAFIVSSKLM